MKLFQKIALCLVLTMLLYACNGSNTFTIEGSVSSQRNGSKIYLRHENEEGEIATIDSTEVENGTFTFEGDASELDMYYITAKVSNSGLSFIAEPGTIKVHIANSPTESTTIGGTPNNDQLQRFNTTYLAFENRVFQYQSQNKAKYQKAVKEKDTATVNALMNKAFALNKKKLDYVLAFPSKNPKSFISLLVLQQRVFSGDTAIQSIKKDFNRIDSKLKTTKIGEAIQSRIKMLESSKSAASNSTPVTIGQPAPNFTANDPEGKTVELNKVLGKKVTVIDFWASWCNPCRRENPNLVKMYAEFQSKGLNIVGVSLDEDRNAWKKAIQKDGITWTQLSNLKGWKDPIALQYQVEEIPCTYVLDRQGNVVAKGLTGEGLRKKIQELLNP